MWRAFWGAAGSQITRDAPFHAKLRSLHRSVLPVFDFKCSRWPPQRTVSEEVDRLQRRLVAILQRLRPQPGGDAV
eukprot:162877-Alexandrium_andersonii.AAC.1